MSEDILFAKEDPNADLAPAEDVVDTQKYLIFLSDGLRLGVVADTEKIKEPRP